MMTILLLSLMAGAAAVFLYAKLRPAKAASVGDAVKKGVDDLDDKFRAEWTDADIYVARSRRLWPSLKANPFFWAGVATSTMICFLGFMGASALAQGVFWLVVLYCAAFVFANLIQAAIAVLGDHGRGEWYEFKTGDRPAWHWPILLALLFVNFVASITGSSNVAEVLATTSEINVSSLESRRNALARAEEDLDALRTRRLQEAPGHSAEGIQAKAQELESAADREANRGGCGSKCEAIRRDAVKWRALANDAVRERELGEKIAVMRSELKGVAEDGTARTVASPHGQLVEDVTGGVVTKKQVNSYLSPLFWLLVSAVDIALWLWAGDYAGRYRMEQYRLRAEAANAWLVNAGLPPRYTISSEGIVEDTKALPAPGSTGDTINIDLSESALAKIEKSPRLKEIQSLFDAVLIPSDAHKISIGKAYELFAKIKSEQGHAKYMNPTDFRAAITDYCDILGIELISNQIVGFKVGVSQHAEAAE